MGRPTVYTDDERVERKRIARKNYLRTYSGIIQKIYSHQKERSSKRGQAPPSYDKQWLNDWMLSQGKFYVLYIDWMLSNYSRYYKPSVDRICDELPYTKDNIQLMSFRDNWMKGIKNDKERGHVKIHNK